MINDMKTDNPNQDIAWDLHLKKTVGLFLQVDELGNKIIIYSLQLRDKKNNLQDFD